jgi:hypothetical protein
LSCGGSPYACVTDASSYVFSLDALWADQTPDAGLECTYYGSECVVRRALPISWFCRDATMTFMGWSGRWRRDRTTVSRRQ